MHQCLRDSFQKLTDGCRKEELKLNIIQSRDVRLRPKLNKACSDEITVFCQGIQPGARSHHPFLNLPANVHALISCVGFRVHPTP